MVDRSIGIHPEADPAAILEHPAIRREADTTLAPCKARRRTGGQGLERGLFDRVSQLACIAIDPRPLIGRQRTGKDKFKPAAQGRSAMRVGRADDEPFPRQFHLSAQPRRHFLNYLRPDRAIVDGYQHSRATVRLAVGSDRQSPRLEPAGNTLRLGLSRLIADHPNRIIRRDVDDGGADRHLLGRECGWPPNQCSGHHPE